MVANQAATTPPRTATLGGPMAWWVWTLAVIFVVYLFSFQTGYSIVNPRVQKDVGLSIAQVGTIAAACTWAFAIAQFFGGALLDRPGSHRCVHGFRRCRLRRRHLVWLAKFSFMFGLVQFAASLFSAFHQNFLNWALRALAWRQLFTYVGVFGIALLVVAAVWLRDPALRPQGGRGGAVRG